MLVVISAVGGFLLGYGTGVISGAMIPIKRQFDLSNEYQEVIVSITLVGAILSSLTSAFLNDKYGRRLVLLISAFFFTLGSLILGLSFGVAPIIIGRFIVGLGLGELRPVYTTDFYLPTFYLQTRHYCFSSHVCARAIRKKVSFSPIGPEIII